MKIDSTKEMIVELVEAAATDGGMWCKVRVTKLINGVKVSDQIKILTPIDKLSLRLHQSLIYETNLDD